MSGIVPSMLGQPPPSQRAEAAKDEFTDRVLVAAEVEAAAAWARQARQLRLIDEVASLARAEAIGCWLRGGWALDFALGEVTRPHGDIDLFVWGLDADRFSQLLVGRGYAPVAGPSPQRQRNFRREGEDLHAALLAADERGRVVTPGVPHEEFPWPSGLLDPAPKRIGDVVCAAISLEGQLWAKETGPRLLGRAHRGYDAADLKRLRRALAAPG